MSRTRQAAAPVEHWRLSPQARVARDQAAQDEWRASWDGWAHLPVDYVADPSGDPYPNGPGHSWYVDPEDTWDVQPDGSIDGFVGPSS